MMINETYLDFCFIQPKTGRLSVTVQEMFQSLFKGQRLHWYLDHKIVNDLEIVVAEVKGMSRWTSEEEVIDHLEENAGEDFWSTLNGYQLYVYPAGRCGTCGTH
ncbi:hypothetical protein [Halobacillus massiliensis]|uniref:hypothetical protein n=1 Tax=Halobacillus massiliensis TaxID=1926286 RepID=UPI001FE5D666|nr:hypothetical protein [Halobacillus massiliensis]